LNSEDETIIFSKLSQAIELIKSGNKADALPLLQDYVINNLNDENGWLWLFACVESDAQRKFCLTQALRINPNHQKVREVLTKLEIKIETSSQKIPAPVNYVPVEKIANSDAQRKKNQIRSIEKIGIILFLGILLLIGGGIGVYEIYGQVNATGTIPTPQPTPVQIFATPLAVISSPTPSSASTLPIPEIVKTPTPIFESFNGLSQFVHASAASGLETPLIPQRIVIPSVGIDAPVVIADYNSTNVDGETFGQWQAPNLLAAGWQPDSALLSKVGNTVINGHHNEYGEVFGKLVDVKIGDKVYVYSNGKEFSFIVVNRMILLERGVSTDTRLQNARWLAPTDDMRLTLVTCWPKTSNTHRLILVARPDDLVN
jgi:LPXTG-site transpeptidase (sortase) family protein